MRRRYLTNKRENIQKSIKIIFILLCFYVLFIFDIPRNDTILDIPEQYWNTKILDFVKRGNMKEIKFNSTDFLKFARELGLPQEERYYASMSGSMVTLPDGMFMHISRILHLDCDDAYLEDGTYNGNCFQRPIRSLVYATVLNKEFEEIKTTYKSREYPAVLDIYEPESFLFAGPEDARAILDPWENVIVSFNMAEVTSVRKRRIWRYNMTSGSLRQHIFTQTGAFQKNWVPFFIGDEMRYVYGWSPLKVVDCTVVYKTCEFVGPNLDKETIYGGGVGFLRGGSGLYNYMGYYVGTVRTHHVCQGSKRVYRPSIVILSPDFKIIYISEILEFQELFLAPFWPHFPNWESIPADGNHARILTTLTMTPDHGRRDWYIGFSINDQKNIIVTLEGFGHFINSMIKKHKESVLEVPDLASLKVEESNRLCDPFVFE